ncbi:hypothetical protein BOX15_Mlig009527g4, partial [Macrostomum lignano]
LLRLELGDRCYRFACSSCPYIYNVLCAMEQTKYPQLKEIDDILGGEDAWKNAATTEERCPECSHMQCYFVQMQTRSADEPMTTKYRCAKCAFVWKD